MKKLIYINFIVAILSYSYSGKISLQPLQSLAKQNILQQINQFPCYTSQEKENFNNRIQNQYYHQYPSQEITPDILDFKNEYFKYINLSEITLWNANLEGCTFEYTILQKADLRGCLLKNANFNNADLKEARLSGSDLTGCCFKGANLQKADLQECILKNANFNNANLKEACLIGVDLKECCFKGASLQNAWLTPSLQLPNYKLSADIIKYYLSLSNPEDKKMLNELIGTGSFNLRLQHLEGLNLTGINFKNCDLACAYLQRANLTDVQLENTTLREAKLSQTILSRDFTLPKKASAVDLIRLYAKETTTQNEKDLLNKILGAEFVNIRHTSKTDEIDLSHLNLQGINLSNSYMLGVNLRETNLIGAKLNNAFFQDSKLQGTLLFNRFKVPNYQKHADFIRIYSDSLDSQEKENLNLLFNIMCLRYEYLHHEDLINLQYCFCIVL